MIDHEKYKPGMQVTYHSVRNGKLEVFTGEIDTIIIVARGIDPRKSLIKAYLMTDGRRAFFSEIEEANKKYTKRSL